MTHCIDPGSFCVVQNLVNVTISSDVPGKQAKIACVTIEIPLLHNARIRISELQQLDSASPEVHVLYENSTGVRGTPFKPSKCFMQCLAINFEYPSVCKWFTSPVVIENQRCPNKFDCC